MIPPTSLFDHVDPVAFLKKATRATTTADINEILAKLPITSEDDYIYDEDNPENGWQPGRFHWVPVGRERGNAGRIKQANQPVNPIAERTVNGMEAIIELARQRELLADPHAKAPTSPRDAVKRYFGVPSLDQIPKLPAASYKQGWAQARSLAQKLRVRLVYDKASKEFAVAIEDDGIGQAPANVHRTLLSLGSTTKADKWYLIGVFGQGGSSAYMVSTYSWALSRRPADLLDGAADGAGWTIIKHIFPKGRRDDFYAYLACTPEGHVPSITAAQADQALIPTGTRFVHIGYDFGRGGSAINRQLYTALNHILYNPILPFDLYVGSTAATVWGNGYRLSSLGSSSNTNAPVLDKLFPPQPVGA